MSKNWYPVIDYTECTECGSCTDKCEHGVYDKLKAPTPFVVYPEGCIEGCKGCGDLCPNDAILYVGDVQNNKGCDCGGDCCGQSK